MDPIEEFETRNREMISAAAGDRELAHLTERWFDIANRYEYSYHFSWLSRPVIQYPQDMVAMQELIWSVRPDLIIETGVAHGGSLILSASMLALLDYCDAIEQERTLDPGKPGRHVVGIDIDIRDHNRKAIETHPLSNRIALLQGSSTAPETVSQAKRMAAGAQRVLVCLDSNHTHEHVLAELEAYAPLVSPGSYCVVFDTIIEDLPDSAFPDRPWGKGNNPKTAVREYLRRLRDYRVAAADGSRLELYRDKSIESKLLITVAPDGFLRRPAC
jgi:cephalosporin hydroxylase